VTFTPKQAGDRGPKIPGKTRTLKKDFLICSPISFIQLTAFQTIMLRENEKDDDIHSKEAEHSAPHEESGPSSEPQEVSVPMPPSPTDTNRDFGEEKNEVGEESESVSERMKKNKSTSETKMAPVVKEKIETKPSEDRQQSSPDTSGDTNNVNDRSSTWMKYCVSLIAITLLVILGMTVAIFIEFQDDNDSDRNVNQNDGDLSDDEQPTISPSLQPFHENPTPIPSLSTFQPTTTNDCQISTFNSIANQPGAVLLSGLQECQLGIFACEAKVVLPFEFPYYNSIYVSPADSYTTIFVSPDATIRFFKNGFSNIFCASDCAGIAVARGRVPHEFYSGEIWTLAEEEKFTVSWENISFDGECCDTLINAQATLYPNGDVLVCWGSGNIIDLIYAGIWDMSRASGIDFPMLGDPFWDTGQAEEWPTNQCRTFKFSLLQWTFPDQESSLTPYSCESPQCIQLPFDAERESLIFGTVPSAGVFNPASACPRFDEDSNQKTKWYDFSATDSCACVQVRSMDSPFIVGVYKSQTGVCDSLSCIENSDFTSESIVWRTVPGQSYKIAVSLMPFADGGSYQLRVIESPTLCAGQMEPNSSLLLPGSCS
jgi:hypothetical protein